MAPPHLRLFSASNGRWTGRHLVVALSASLVIASASSAAACSSPERAVPENESAVQAATAVAEPVWEDISPPISFNFADFNSQNYGAQTIAVAPSDPEIVYLGTCYQGIWRTEDGGDSWIKVNTGRHGDNLDTGRNWTLAIDPTDPDTLYTTSGYGFEQGVWKSIDGGVNWRQMLPESISAQTTADIYSIAIDPADNQHLLVGSHSGWAGGPSSGVLESLDAGRTWTIHEPEPSWGTGHYVFFIDPTTWLLTTQYDGYWRTDDSGESWEKVSDLNMTHGGNQLYRTDDDLLFTGAMTTLLMSTDEGLTWDEVGPRSQDGYQAVIGDGHRLYAQPAYTGLNTAEVDPPYYVAAEDDGTDWAPLNEQVFPNGPMAMAFDPENRIVYSSNWDAGVWRLRV